MMRIIIPRIPRATTRNELFRLVSEVLSKKMCLPYTKRPEITACRIVRISDSRGVIEHFGIVEVPSEKLGRWLLVNFKNQRLHNKLVFAREYSWRGSDNPAFVQSCDRRRPNLKIETLQFDAVRTEGLEEFVREHT